VQAQAPKIIGNRARGDATAQKGLESLSQIGIRETMGQEAKEDERVQEGLYTLGFEAQGGGSLPVHHTRALNGVKASFSNRAVMADSLDVE